MELTKVSEAIEQRIRLLEQGRKKLQEIATNKAKTISDYEKAIALTLMKLKNDVSMELEGELIQKPPASIMEKVARGICWKEKLDMEKADADYRCAITGMNAIEAELNGFQSINRYLKEV